MTGNAEHSIALCWYKGGRDVKVGDLVTAWHPTETDLTVVKRVAGLPIYSVSRRLFWGLTFDKVTVRVNPFLYLNCLWDRYLVG